MSRLGRFVNQSFDRRISFYFVPLIAGLSIVVAILSYSIFFKAFRQEKEQAAALLVRQIGVNFDYYFRDAKTIIAYLYNNGAVQRAYRYYQDLTFEQKTFLNFDIDEFTIECQHLQELHEGRDVPWGERLSAEPSHLLPG